MTTVYVMKDGESIYTREQAFGGSRLSNSIQSRFGLSPAEAEAAIVSGELPDSYESEVLEPYREELAEQLGRALQFFFSSSQYNDVNLIVLAGGASNTTGLAQKVEESLSTKTVVANPFARMSVGGRVNRAQLQHDASSLMMACGLAVRRLADG